MDKLKITLYRKAKNMDKRRLHDPYGRAVDPGDVDPAVHRGGVPPPVPVPHAHVRAAGGGEAAAGLVPPVPLRRNVLDHAVARYGAVEPPARHAHRARDPAVTRGRSCS